MKKIPLIAWLAIFAVVLLWNLGALNVTIMEARNFVTAREMVEDGSYLIPTLNGEYRLQKPPLPTWMTAAVMMITNSQAEFWLRIPAVLLGLLGIFFSMKIVKISSRESIDVVMTGSILVTSFYFFWTARSGMWDIFAQGFTVMAIYYYMRFMITNSVRNKYGLLFGLCLAASFMSKGPVAIYGLFLPFLCAFHVLKRKEIVWDKIKVVRLILGVIVALVLASLWPIFIYFSEAATAAKEIAKVESENWSNYNVKPFYHYWSFPVQSGIWTVFGFVGLVAYISCYRQMKENKASRFYFWWTLMVIFFLSLVPEKKERYLLPVLFPLAMFLSEIIQSHRSSILHTTLRLAGGLTALVLLISSVILMFDLRPEISAVQHRQIGGALLMILSLVSMYFIYRDRLDRAVYTVASAFAMLVIVFLGSASELLNSTDAVKSFSVFNENEALKTLPLISTSVFRPELIYYIGRKAIVVSDDEFPTEPDRIGVFSFNGINKEVDSRILQNWNIVSEERYDQNPKFSKKKPNIALKRYFAILEKK